MIRGVGETKAVPQFNGGKASILASPLAKVGVGVRDSKKAMGMKLSFKRVSNKAGNYLSKERNWLKSFLKIR